MPDIEDEVRKLAHSLPPSDFGSTCAIQAVAEFVRTKLEDTEARRLRAVASMEAMSQDLGEAQRATDVVSAELAKEQEINRLVRQGVAAAADRMEMLKADLAAERELAEKLTAERNQLATFTIEFIRIECWGYPPEVDGGDVQDLAEMLELIAKTPATAEDAERIPDVCEGDPIFKFAPWLAAFAQKQLDADAVHQQTGETLARLKAEGMVPAMTADEVLELTRGGAAFAKD